MRAYQFRSHLWVVAIISLIAISCLPGATGGVMQPTVVTSEEATQAPTQAVATTAVPTASQPTRQPAIAGGTILLQRTADLSASTGGRLEISFEGHALLPVSIETTVTSGTPAYDFRLVDKYGNYLVVYSSAPSVPVESIAEITLPYDGTYKLVIVPTSGEGGIGTRVTALASATGGGTIEAGGNVEALIHAARTYHTYQVTLSQGQAVTLATKAAEPGVVDTAITVYSPDGHYLTDADDISSPANLDARVTDFIAPVAGTYTVLVGSKGNGTGSYTFSVAESDKPAAAAGAPDTVYDKDYRANFGDKSNLDVTFDGNIGDVLQISATDVDPGVSLDLYVYSPFGQIVAYAVNATKGRDTKINELQLPYTGRFKLEMRPAGDGQATFKIAHLSQPPTGGGVLSDQQKTLPGKIAAANVFHVYQFDAKAGDMIALAAFSVSKSGTLDLGFALIGPNGRQLLFADDSESQFPKDPELHDYELMQTGTYTVIVYSFTTATGTYDIVFTRK